MKEIMKKYIYLFLLLLVGLPVIAQNETDPVVQVFKSANIDQIEAYFDDFIDLKLLDKDEVKNMSKNQASIALKAFYVENGIKGFEKVSDGGRTNLVYLLGKLPNGGKGFSITIQLKQKAGKLQIITLRIS
jgi:Domain of unknown function (DUF4783)